MSGVALPVLTRLGSSFYCATLTASAVTQILAPGANVNGLILRWFDFGVAAAASLYLDTAAPSSEIDNTKRRLFRTSQSLIDLVQQPNLLVPAGIGMWWATSATGAGSISLGWDLL